MVPFGLSLLQNELFTGTYLLQSATGIKSFRAKALQCVRLLSSTDEEKFTLVETEQGKLRGKTGYDYKGGVFYSFQGIPYAKPPLGKLRFKAPVPPEPWQDVRDARVEAGAPLSQHFVYKNKILGSEDCLYLNVYTPQLPLLGAKSLKPVMFWIYGGRFITGSSKTSVYGPEILVTGDVVLVTFNYRLGLLGFLSMKDPSLGVPGNAGLKDILLALKWVQKNIKNFGGDPNNVTITGGSAGAAAAHALILSPMAKGLFHRAILQSACLLNPFMFGGKNANRYANVLGCNSNHEKDVLDFLRSVPATKIMEAQNSIPDPCVGDEIRPLGLVLEDECSELAIISKSPLDIIKSGDYNKVPIIIGYNSHENMYIEEGSTGVWDYIGELERFIPYYYNIPKGSQLSLKIANKLKEVYYGNATPTKENMEPFNKLSMDFMILNEIFKFMKHHLRTQDEPIYSYKFSADTQRNFFKLLMRIKGPGACHSDELGYLFQPARMPSVKENSLESLIVQRMVKLWTNFAKTGNPNSVEKDPILDVTWKPIEKDSYCALDIGSELRFGKNSDLGNMKIWEEISALIKSEQI